MPLNPPPPPYRERAAHAERFTTERAGLERNGTERGDLRLPLERDLSRLLREALDGDTERGFAVLGSDRRVLYSNSTARSHLRDGTARGIDPLLPQSVDTCVEALLARVHIQRAPATIEVVYPSEVERRLRLTLEAVVFEGRVHVLLRVLPATPWVEPTVRRLQTRFGLTVREAQVAAAVARGLSNAEVAQALGIVEKTVKNVLMAVYQKCEVRNRVELALRAYDAPLAQNPR